MPLSKIQDIGNQVIPNLGRRNMIINGGMNICQRATSATGVGATEGYQVQDRYDISVGGTATAGRFTVTKETTDVPDGFNSAMKLDCTTADTSVAAGEFLSITQHIETSICNRLASGTSSAKQVTLSFYAKANANATYVVQLLNNKHSGYIHNNRTFNVTTSYQRFSITFQADTTADSKFDGDQTVAGLSVSFILHAGSDFTSATLASDWATGATNRAAGADSFYDSTDNTFFLTGVQLEVGDTASDFEHLTSTEDLALCQRYYVKYYSGTLYARLGIASNLSTTAAEVYNYLPVPMRDNPSLETTGTVGNYCLYDSDDTLACTNLIMEGGNHDNNQLVILDATVSSGLTDGGSSQLMGYNNSSAFIAFSSEL